MHDYRKGGYIPGGSVTGGATAGGITGNMGHEAAGIVVELGEGVHTLSLGQRVGVSAIAGCGHCSFCANGQYTWCSNYKFYDSMHAEYFTIAALACHPLPNDVPWEVGVLITGDGMGVPYHTSTKINRNDINTIAVFGLGPIGLGNVLFQTYLGRQVIGIDRSPDRLDLARRLGAVHTVAVTEETDVPAAIRNLTEGEEPMCVLKRQEYQRQRNNALSLSALRVQLFSMVNKKPSSYLPAKISLGATSRL